MAVMKTPKTTVTMRIPIDEKTAWEACASAARLTLTQWVRDCLDAATRGEPRKAAKVRK